MSFEPVEVVWNGQTYTIPPNKVLGAIARVESVVTLGELQIFAERRAAPLAKLSMAYGALLRYAGAAISDEDVSNAVFTGADQGVVMNAIAQLLLLMVPAGLRDAPKDAPKGDEPQGKA